MSGRLTALEAMAAEQAAAGLILDFDGVLSPIVQDPDTSVLPAQVGESLARLASSLVLVAIISGRPVDFLASRVRLHGVRLLGSYGMEQIQADGSRLVEERAQEWVGKIPAAGQRLTVALADLAGV